MDSRSRIFIPIPDFSPSIPDLILRSTFATRFGSLATILGTFATLFVTFATIFDFFATILGTSAFLGTFALWSGDTKDAPTVV